MNRRIIIRAQTVDEEFEYLMNILNKMNFYNQHGYKIPIPDHPFFLHISNNLNLLKSLDVEKAKVIFKTDVYNSKFFKKGIKTVEKDIKIIEKAIKRMNNWKNWNFKLFPEYKIKLTAYGPGGSYDFHRGTIIMKTKESGEFDNGSSYHMIIHEIVHIGIEESIVEKFGLTHLEKEGLVDSICANYFDDLLINYKVQDRGSKKIFDLISKNNIMELPRIIKEYKKK